MVVSLTAVTEVNAVFAPSSSFTWLTAELAVPPKKPVPVIVTAVTDRLDPVDGLNVVTVGPLVVTVNFVVLVELVPPAAVTITL